MIFHENCLPADNSHEISWLICYFWKSSAIWDCRLLQIIGGALRVKKSHLMAGMPLPWVHIQTWWNQQPSDISSLPGLTWTVLVVHYVPCNHSDTDNESRCQEAGICPVPGEETKTHNHVRIQKVFLGGSKYNYKQAIIDLLAKRH